MSDALNNKKLIKFVGGKDRTSGRQMFSKLSESESNSFRTVIQNTPEQTLRLDTKGGMPRLTITRKEESVEPVEYIDAILYSELRPLGIQRKPYDTEDPHLHGIPHHVRIKKGKVQSIRPATGGAPALAKVSWKDSKKPKNTASVLRTGIPDARLALGNLADRLDQHTSLYKYLESLGAQVVVDVVDQAVDIRASTSDLRDVHPRKFDYALNDRPLSDALLIPSIYSGPDLVPRGCSKNTVNSTLVNTFLTYEYNGSGDLRVVEYVNNTTVVSSVVFLKDTLFPETVGLTNTVNVTWARGYFSSTTRKLALRYRYYAHDASMSGYWAPGWVSSAHIVSGLMEIDIDTGVANRYFTDTRPQADSIWAHRFAPCDELGEHTSKTLLDYGYFGDELRAVVVKYITTGIYDVTPPPDALPTIEGTPFSHHTSQGTEVSLTIDVLTVAESAVHNLYVGAWSSLSNYDAEWVNYKGPWVDSGSHIIGGTTGYTTAADVVRAAFIAADFSNDTYVLSLFHDYTSELSVNVAQGVWNGRYEDVWTRSAHTCRSKVSVHLFSGGVEALLVDALAVSTVTYPGFSRTDGQWTAWQGLVWAPFSHLPQISETSGTFLHFDTCFSADGKKGVVSVMCSLDNPMMYQQVEPYEPWGGPTYTVIPGPVSLNSIVSFNYYLYREKSTSSFIVRELEIPHDLYPGEVKWLSVLNIPDSKKRSFK